jgi:K+-transporting ATPase ATPase C chain
MYPLLVMMIGQTIFPFQSHGSLIKDSSSQEEIDSEKRKILGSSLIAQEFTSSHYFWPRPSFVHYQATQSGGSQYSPISFKLKKMMINQESRFQHSDKKIPSELVLNSGSGLDPHISPEGIFIQMDRVAKARNLSEEQRHLLKTLVDESLEKSLWGILGQDRVNVFLLNVKLDQRFPHSTE